MTQETLLLEKKILTLENHDKGIGILPKKILKFKEQSKELKILTPKQTFQRLPIVLAQVKADNTSENLNQTCEIIYFSYQANKINKKVCNNILISTKL